MIKNIGNVQDDTLLSEKVSCKIACYMTYDEQFLLILNSDIPIGGVLCSDKDSVRSGFEVLISQWRNHIALDIDSQYKFPNSVGYAKLYDFEVGSSCDMKALDEAISSARAKLEFFCRDSFLLTFQEWVLDLNEKTYELMPINPEWEYLLLSPNRIAREAYDLFYKKYSALRDEVNSFVDKMYLFSEVTKRCEEGNTVLSRCCAIAQNDFPSKTEIQQSEYVVLFSCVDTTAHDRLLNIDVEIKPTSKFYIKDFSVELSASGEGTITVYSYLKCSANLPKISREVIKFNLIQRN